MESPPPDRTLDPLLDARAAHLAALTRRVEAEAERIAAETAAAELALRRERLLLGVFLLAIVLVPAAALLDPALLQALGAGGLLVGWSSWTTQSSTSPARLRYRSWRIVFRVDHEEAVATVCVIGDREDGICYEEAKRRAEATCR